MSITANPNHIDIIPPKFEAYLNNENFEFNTYSRSGKFADCMTTDLFENSYFS
jgi:hypothetical protein